MADVVKYGIQIPNRVFVGGVAFDTNEEDLKEFFSQYGKIKDCKIIKDNQNISRGFAFVTFECKHDAVQTQQLGTVFFNQKKLNLGPAIRQKGVVFNGAKDVENEPVLSTGVYIHPNGYHYTVAPNGVWYFHNEDGKPPVRVPGTPPMAYASNLIHKKSCGGSTEQTILLRKREDSIGDSCSNTTCDSAGSPQSNRSSPPIATYPDSTQIQVDVQTVHHPPRQMQHFQPQGYIQPLQQHPMQLAYNIPQQRPQSLPLSPTIHHRMQPLQPVLSPTTPVLSPTTPIHTIPNDAYIPYKQVPMNSIPCTMHQQHLQPLHYHQYNYGHHMQKHPEYVMMSPMPVNSY